MRALLIPPYDPGVRESLRRLARGDSGMTLLVVVVGLAAVLLRRARGDEP